MDKILQMLEDIDTKLNIIIDMMYMKSDYIEKDKADTFIEYRDEHLNTIAKDLRKLKDKIKGV